MNEVLYTVQVDTNVIADNIRAEYVPMIIKGILSECFADDRLEIRVIAQQNKGESSYA